MHIFILHAVGYGWKDMNRQMDGQNNLEFFSDLKKCCSDHMKIFLLRPCHYDITLCSCAEMNSSISKKDVSVKIS